MSRVPVYRKIAETLRREIDSSSPEPRLPGEVRLAARFGVNPRTVREAFRLLEKEGRIERRQGRATRILDARAGKPVAIVLERDIAEPRVSYAMLRIFQRVRQVLGRNGLRCKPYLGFRQAADGPDAELTCLDFIEDLNADRLAGVVILGTEPRPQWKRLFDDPALPVAGLDPGYPLSIGSDPVELVRAGTRYLIEQGRRRLALLAWLGPQCSPHSADLQVPTFQTELESAGLPFRPEWVRGHSHPMLPGAGWEEFRETWLRPDRPDGLLVTDDVLFQDASLALLELGIEVPRQLLVVTHANKGSGIRYPFPVATLESDPDRIADTLCRMFLQRMRGETVAECRVIIPSRLIPLAGMAETEDSRLRVEVSDT